MLLAAACSAPGSVASETTTATDTEATSEGSEASSGTSDDDTSSSDASDTSAGSATGGEFGEPFFIDRADEAGVSYTPGEHHKSPDCLVIAEITGTGAFCAIEWSAGGAAAGDYDNDGYTDLYVTRLYGPDLLYRNQGDGTFVDRAADAGVALEVATNGATWGDLDNDGDLDLYVTTIGDTRYYLFINDGRGHFSEQGIERGAALETPQQHTGTTPTVGDFDHDGYLDLFVGDWRNFVGLGEYPSHSRLLRNLGTDGPAQFEDVTDAAGVSLEEIEPEENIPPGVFSFSPGFVDLDSDGWSDLVIASDFGTSRLFWNNGDGTFTDGTVDANVGTDRNGMGSTFGDYDGDGDLDWFVTAVWLPGDQDPTGGNRLFRNEGDRTFTDVTWDLGVLDGGWGWGTVFFDHDNDADVDLVMTNGWVWTSFENDPTRFWDNQDGALVERSKDLGLDDKQKGRGLLTFDYDNDGYLDLFISNYTQEPLLYHNEAAGWGDWLRVKAIGTVTNRDGIGARVIVRATAGGAAQVREIGSQSYYLGQSERIAHFGFGEPEDTAIAEVEIYWPVSGQTQVLTDVERNQLLVVTEP